MEYRERMTPRDYARYRSRKTDTIVQAQLVYYYARRGEIELAPCPCCGNRVLETNIVDEFFDKKYKEEK